MMLRPPCACPALNCWLLRHLLGNAHTHHFPNGSIGMVGSCGDELQGPCRKMTESSYRASGGSAQVLTPWGWVPDSALLLSFPMSVPGAHENWPRVGHCKFADISHLLGVCQGWCPIPLCRSCPMLPTSLCPCTRRSLASSTRSSWALSSAST